MGARFVYYKSQKEPADDIAGLAAGKKVLFVYGGASVCNNGCYEDVKKAVSAGKGEFFGLGDASRELRDIERGLELVKQHGMYEVIVTDYTRFWKHILRNTR